MTAARPDVARAFKDFISEQTFPCVGAKAALGQGHLEVLVGGNLCDGGDDRFTVQSVQTFASRSTGETAFASFCVVFPDTPPLEETQFEHALWRRLQAMHDLDARKYAWDPAISSDPRSPDFGLSLGGRGFYVVGLHPGASRPARRFGHAAMVFNLHSQFDRLRADGRYDKLKHAITERDVTLAGSVNPMLAAHGVTSEAPQYSGRAVGAGWACPFKPRPRAVQ